MRTPRRGAGGPEETGAPALSAAPRPCAPAPSPAPRSRRHRAQAPGRPGPQLPPDGSGAAQSPDPCAGCAVSGDPQGPLRMADAHSQPPAEARPRRSASPCRPGARRGRAPRRSGGGSQIVTSLLAEPPPPPCRPAVGRAPPFPGPSSSPECCTRQARSPRAELGTGLRWSRDERRSLVLVWSFSGVLHRLPRLTPRCFDVLGWSPLRRRGCVAWACGLRSCLCLLAFVVSFRAGQTQTHTSFPGLTFPALLSQAFLLRSHLPVSSCIRDPIRLPGNVRVSPIQFYR